MSTASKNYFNLLYPWLRFYRFHQEVLANLKEYVLDRRCKGEEIISFLSQVASALHYFHINHIVHGDLRAEYVNVVTPQKVRVPTFI